MAPAPSLDRSIVAGRDLCGLVCPACGRQLDWGEESSTCDDCGRAFPIVAGLADLRLGPDRYLGLEPEREKARRLAGRESEADLLGLARVYYAMTDDVDEARRDRYLAHIEGAGRRGGALLDRLPKEGRILEVGCGTGGLLAAAARSGRRIEGADIALRWLVVARRRLADRGVSVGLVAAGADRLPWGDGAFDIVVADSLLEHLDDPASALREWRRVVRPGGRLVIWSPNRHSLLADPHVGLWGLGWLPAGLAGAYVRWRRGCEWTVRPRSAREARRLAIGSGWEHVRISAVGIPEDWGRSRIARRAIRAYRAANGLPCLRSIVREFGPLWQLEAIRGGAA